MHRVAVAVVLCFALAGLAFGFGLQFAGSGAYPDYAALDANYGAHVGERVHVWGTVVAAGDRVVVAAGPLRLAVSEPPPAAVETGDTIQVFGRLRPDRRMTTVAYHAVPPTRTAYMYGASVVGIAVAAGAFLRRWRPDADELWFAPRETPEDG
ncbi:MAG: hypothetical protein ABEH56_02960 [Salinirussus sp.]